MYEPMASIFAGKAESITKQIAPPVDKFERGYLYVLRLTNGFTKIGMSAEPVLRLKSLKRGLRSTNVEFDKLWLSAAHINYKENEKTVLKFLEGKKRDGEFFKISFKEALSVVSGLSMKVSFTLDEIEEKKASSTAFINALNNLHEIARNQKTKA